MKRKIHNTPFTPKQQEAFTSAFIKHYSRVSVALVNSIDRQTISNRVVHVSVQLLSPERLAMKMVREYHLLHIMLASLDHMMRCILIDSGLNGACRFAF